MSDKNKLIKLNNWLAENYQNNPTIRIAFPIIAALAGISTGDMVTATFAAGTIASLAELFEFSASRISQERIHTLTTELETNQIALTDDVIQSEKFIHSTFVVTRAALRTYQRDKIRRFARILLSAIEKDELASDKFEEFVRILEDLSGRELQLLVMLKEFEDDNPHQLNSNNETENDFSRSNRFWEDFVDKVQSEIGIQSNILASLLTGLNRTGLYETFAGAFIDYSGGQGKTTALFEEFREWVIFEDETTSIIYPD